MSYSEPDSRRGEWARLLAAIQGPDQHRRRLAQVTAAVLTFEVWRGDRDHRPGLRARPAPTPFDPRSYAENVRVEAWQRWVDSCLAVAGHNAGVLRALLDTADSLDLDPSAAQAARELRGHLAYDWGIDEIPATATERRRLVERITSLDRLIAATPRPAATGATSRRRVA